MRTKGCRRVRTGCRTCRLRKIKCDETKPICQRCTDGRRKCPGYEVVVAKEGIMDRKTQLMEALEAIAVWKKNSQKGLLDDLAINQERLHNNFGTVMWHLANSINSLNDNPFEHQTQIAASIQSMIIIQKCHYDVPDFPSLHTQHRLTLNIAIDALGMVSSIENIEHASNSAILEAVQYVRSVVPGIRMDSSLSPNDPIISAHQGQIFASFDQCHRYSRDFIAYSRNYTRQPLSNRDRLSCMEAEMKYRTAKICVSVCHSCDESAYDRFKDLFEGVVLFAKSILDSCPEALEYTNSDFDFDFDKSSYLPLLKFVILKCRWLGIRYDAWLILQKLATRQKNPVIYKELCDLGQRIIEKEHRVRIEEVTQDHIGLFSPPAEEWRVRHYTTDERFADLVTVQNVDGEGLARVQMNYTQRLLLRCGSRELSHLAEWVEKIPFSSPQVPRYTVEQVDFIIYCRADCGLEWDKVAITYSRTFLDSNAKNHKRGLAGLRNVYYRKSQKIPVTDSEGLLVFDENNKPKTKKYKVRQQVKNSVVVGLLDMHPERAITYSWVSEEHKKQCRTLAELRQAQLDNAVH